MLFENRPLHFAPTGAAVHGASQGAPADQAAADHAAAVPFTVGSNLYREAPFVTVVQLLDGNPHETIANITPGGFLRGVVLQVTSAGGAIGTGVLSADAPFSIFSQISIEDISGGPILYPMSGFAAMAVQKYLRPWDGDPAKRPGFSNSINPSFTLRMMVEIRETLAVLANTDARAQYRLRFMLAPLNPGGGGGLLSTTGTATAPTVTVKAYIEAWSQPDREDLVGNPIEPTPPGLIVSRFLMHELPVIVAGNNVVKHGLTGNEFRGVVWVVRNSLGARVDLTDASAGAMDFRIDNRRLWKMNQSQLVEEMNWFYEQIANATWTRDTGVYAYPRFRDPGRVLGEYWLQTVEQTLLQIEFVGGDLGANVPGQLEIIYDELAIADQHLPVALEGL